MVFPSPPHLLCLHTALSHFMGLAQLRRAPDPWDPELASCLSFPSCATCPSPALPKPNIFPENRGTPDIHCGSLMVGGHLGSRGPQPGRLSPLPPGFASRSPVCPELSAGRAGAGFSSCDNSES